MATKKFHFGRKVSGIFSVVTSLSRIRKMPKSFEHLISKSDVSLSRRRTSRKSEWGQKRFRNKPIILLHDSVDKTKTKPVQEPSPKSKSMKKKQKTNDQLSNDTGEMGSASLYPLLLSITTKLIEGSMLSEEEISSFEHYCHWANNLYHSRLVLEPEEIIIDEPDRGAERIVRPQGEEPDQEEPHQHNGYRTWQNENHRGFTR